jgi:hypothetical protein
MDVGVFSSISWADQEPFGFTRRRGVQVQILQ